MIKLKPIVESDYDSIKELTKLKTIMKHVGNGKTWDDKKVSKFIEYNLNESKLSDNVRDNYYFKISTVPKSKSKSSTKYSKLLGIIGFHKFAAIRDHKNYYLTIFIHPNYQNKGVFSKSLELLIHKIKKHKPNLKFIYSLTHESNQNMISLSHHKFSYDRTVNLNNMKLIRFKIFILDKKNKYQKNFYLVKSNYIKNNTTKKVFDSLNKTLGYNCWEEFNENKNQIRNPLFLYLDSHYIQSKNYRKYNPLIKNLVDDDKYSIANKANLYDNLIKIKSRKPTYLKNQINFNLQNLNIKNLNSIQKLFSNNILIMKPVDGFAGKGIEVLENFTKFKIYLSKLKSNDKLRKFKNWIIQEYITNPLLIYNKKFHIRSYFLYVKRQNNKTKSSKSSKNTINKEGYFLDIAKIFTSKNDYIKGDYQNQSIHDTHLKSTPEPLYFPNDFKKIFGKQKTDKVLKEIIVIFKDLLKVINAKCYSESKECFELFGVDLMIDENFKVKLIEVNTKIGLGTYKNDKIDINEIILKNLLDVVLSNFKENRFIKL